LNLVPGRRLNLDLCPIFVYEKGVRNKNLLFIFLPVILAGLLPVSCAKPACVAYIDPAVKEYAAEFFSRHPLPGEYAVEITHSNTSDAEITVFQAMRSGWTYREGYEYKTIARRWLAPAAMLWDTSPQQRRGLVPLEEITLPMRGMDVNGSFPGDTDYPYCLETIVSVKKSCAPALRRWFDNIAAAAEKPPLVWIAVVGDIMPARGVQEILMTDDNGMQTVFNDTWPVLLAQDLLLGNLEGAVTHQTKRLNKKYTFKFENQVLFYLTHAGFDYLSLANNHSFDYGLQGFIDTLDNFRVHGMPTSGAGLNLAEARRPWRTTVGPQEVRVLSLGAHPQDVNVFEGETQSVATEERPGILWEGDEAFSAVKAMCSKQSFDIVMVHAGQEYRTHPDGHTTRLFHTLIDLGADAVFAAHPHVLQGMEAYKKGLIAYSLGDFIFPEMGISPLCEQSMILSLGVYNSHIVYVRPIPVRIYNKIIKLDNSGAILRYFYALSAALAHGK
jgi:hypothetical protein